ncbi:MAG: hypothetical protein AAGK97_17450, partial [Bacteroidota bacterium]
MKQKYKTTGCFRFFLALLIIAPIAFFGANYINGEDGVQKIKDFFGGSKDKTEQVDDSPKTSVSESKVKRLEQRIENLEKENDAL